MIPPTRTAGEPERYRGRYQTSADVIGWTGACPACGRDCPWTSSTHTGSQPLCGCPTDTGTGGDGDRGNVGSLGTPPVPGPT